MKILRKIFTLGIPTAGVLAYVYREELDKYLASESQRIKEIGESSPKTFSSTDSGSIGFLTNEQLFRYLCEIRKRKLQAEYHNADTLSIDSLDLLDKSWIKNLWNEFSKLKWPVFLTTLTKDAELRP